MTWVILWMRALPDRVAFSCFSTETEYSLENECVSMVHSRFRDILIPRDPISLSVKYDASHGWTWKALGKIGTYSQWGSTSAKNSLGGLLETLVHLFSGGMEESPPRSSMSWNSFCANIVSDSRITDLPA